MEGLSVLITARNEKYLEATIRDVLKNAKGEIEILVALDGYLPDPQIEIGDERVKFFHHEESIGQRQALNLLAKEAKGKYIMKLDAHCMVDEGFDIKLAEDCEYDWTVIPRMYNLDVYKWEPKWHKVTDYMYISSPTAEKSFRAQYYEGKAKDEGQRQPKGRPDIDEIMCCMGPCFFMHKDRFWELGGCDEGHGGWGQQGIEVALKAWLSGGKLIVNKKTWFAHWFRGSDGGFPYPASGRQHEAAREYSRDLWLNNKWGKQTRTIEWLVNKFNPPGWREAMNEQELQKTFYHAIHLRKRDPNWRGIRTLKMPSDFLLYQEVIHDKKPDFIIEIGTAYSGSAVFFGDMCELNGHGHVISIDPTPRAPVVPHKRVTYLQGDSKDDEIIKKVKEIVGKGSVMLSIDGLHKRRQVKWELYKYKDIVTPGQYIVVEDCYGREGESTEVMQARDWFMKTTKRYKLDKGISKRFIVGMTKDGWLKRIK